MKEILIIVFLAVCCWTLYFNIKLIRVVRVLQDVLVSAKWSHEACMDNLKDQNARN